MKKIIFLLLIASLSIGFVACGDDDPKTEDGTENNNGNGNSNNGNGNGNNNSTKPPKVYISSSHTIKKDNGFVTGDIQLSVTNNSENEITSVKIVLKSSNQSSAGLGSWSVIKPSHEKTTSRVNILKMKYPIAICTYTYKGKSYSKEYSYY